MTKKMRTLSTLMLAALASNAVAVSAAEVTLPSGNTAARHADFKTATPSLDAKNTADWIVDSGDNKKMPFLLIDKRAASAFAFDREGHLTGVTPVLLGASEGDDSSPGIGQKKLADITPDERTTPAGRFVASLDRNIHGTEILWIDYDAAISLHRVVKGTPKERRAQRLASEDPKERRISYGCINVPASFYERVVSPAFKKTSGIVYVLPETRSPMSVFGSYDVDERARLRSAVLKP